LAGLLIDAYENFGQEILEKFIISDEIVILLRSLSDFRVRQLLKHYMGTDKMLQLLGYNEEYNTEHLQSKQLEILPSDIEQYINSNEVFKTYLSDHKFIIKCIFICTLFIFFLTSFNTLQHKQDNRIQLWDKTFQDFTFRVDMEALTYYTQPIYENFDQLCGIFGWNKFLSDWSEESIVLLRNYFDIIGRFKDSLNKKLTLQIKANSHGNYDMYTFKLKPNFSISSIETPINIPNIIAISKHIIKTGQSIQFSTNVSQLDVHFSSVSCHSLVLVGYKHNIFKAKNSWRNEYPSLDIDLERNLQVISYSLQKSSNLDIMNHYSELFAIIDKEVYDRLINEEDYDRLINEQQQLDKKIKEQKTQIIPLPKKILEQIFIIRDKQLELEKLNDELDEFIEENPKSKKAIQKLETEYKKEKKIINTLIINVNKDLKSLRYGEIPIIRGGSKKKKNYKRNKRKTIKQRKRKTIKRRKRRTIKRRN
jgi:hypothetical protein